MCRFLSTILMCILVADYETQLSAAEPAQFSQLPQLDSHKFQLEFLTEVTQQINEASTRYIDDFLKELQKNSKHAEYEQQFVNLLTNSDSQKLYYNPYKAVDEKIVFIKQLLDLKEHEEPSEAVAAEDFFILKNMNFISKLRQHLLELQEQSERELSELKLNAICRQFEEEKQKTESRAYSVWQHLKLAPTVEQLLLQNITSSRKAAAQPPLPPFISLTDFGAAIYERIKLAGAELIDDYLLTIRKLLIEVIDEKPEHERHSDKLNKVLQEIDAILAIKDFADKRERLYAYLQTNMAHDFELFRSSERSQNDLAELMLKLKRRGMDMFFHFLISNFQFLEHLQAEWAKLVGLLQVDTENELLRDISEINKLYVEFKKDSENTKKYEAYTLGVKNLYDRAKLLPASRELKIFEILNNSSQNVGAVTLNMIKSKCEEV